MTIGTASRALPALAITLLCACAGCSTAPAGASRSLGSVPYDKAFEVARTVLTMYYTPQTADSQTGEIICYPEPIKGPPDRLLGNTPARELAKLTLVRQGNEVVAYAQVTFQRLMLTSQNVLANRTYGGVPDDTPSESTGATTPQQNTTWTNVRLDHVREQAILDNIVAALNYGSTTRPATRPATMPATAPRHP